MTSLYQYCITCATETGHTWIKDLVNQCVVCKRENKVSAAQVFVRPEKYAHLQKDEYEELMSKIEQEPEAKLEPPKVEAKTEEQHQRAYETGLPVQGMFVKPTPLEEKYKTLTAEDIEAKIEDAMFGTVPEGKQVIAEQIGNNIRMYLHEKGMSDDEITDAVATSLEQMNKYPDGIEIRTHGFIPEDHGSYIIDREGGLPNIANPPKNLATPAEQIEAFQKVLQVTERKIEEELNKALRPATPQESLPKPPVKKGWAADL